MKNTPRKRRWLAALAAAALAAPAAQALPIITEVVEIGGDDEATDTITARFTGQTFVNGVANEPLPNTPADASYTVGLLAEESPMFVDRNHQWNGATTTQPIPDYLLGGEYIMSGNDNRDNNVGSSRVDLQACKLEYSIVSPK